MSYLKGISSVADSTVTNHVQQNLMMFFDYGLTEISNFVNVNLDTTDENSVNISTLKPANTDDSNYSAGQVWHAPRKNWVWESGVFANTGTDNANPGVSGVYVDDTFYSVSSTGNYSHHIDHQLGRVVFDSAIATTSSVKCEYSYKYINVEICDGMSWFKNIQLGTTQVKDSFTDNEADYRVSAENRVQLPVIGIELSPNRTMSPYQLGGGQWVRTDFLFHCVAEDTYTRDKLIDIVTLQKEKLITGIDLDSVDTANDYPLDYRGVPVSGALTYPNLISTHPGTKIRILNTSLDSSYSLSSRVHVGTIKVTTECLIFGV